MPSDQGKQRRTDGQGQSAAEREIGQGQPNNDVDRPGVKAPVKESQDHGLPGGLHGFAFAHRGQCIMLHRFGHAKEDQADPHACAEQHRKP